MYSIYPKLMGQCHGQVFWLRPWGRWIRPYNHRPHLGFTFFASATSFKQFVFSMQNLFRFFMRCCSLQTNLVCCSFSQQPVRVLYAIGHTHSLCCCSSPHVLCITVILVHCNIMLVQHYCILYSWFMLYITSVLAVALRTYYSFKKLDVYCN